VTGNWRFALTSKNSSSLRKPATGNKVQPVEFSTIGEIASNSGKRSLGMGNALTPSKYSLDAY
jgi:hypothetical protein